MAFRSINPTTGEVLKQYSETSKDEVGRVLEGAREAQLEWGELTFADREKPMRRAAELLREKKHELAKLMAEEMGKPVAQGRSEAEKCAWVCDYYADHAESFLSDETIETDASNSYVVYRPLGVVLAIMPWNFPFWQVFRFAAPNLMAGNAGILKHASNVFGCALAIEEILREAGFPDALFRSLTIGSSSVEDVIRHPIVKAVTLTGSVGAGKAVAENAGSVLKKSVLELGGSDPYVILEDADLESAARICAESRLINSGQSCIAAKRFVVVESVRDRFVELFVEEMKSRKMGDPMDEDVKVGPQARVDLRDDLHGQVRGSIEKGAQLLLGGEVLAGVGAFYPATVLTEVEPGMPAYDEELFGPVAAVISAPSEDAAIETANDSSFGLGAAVFTEDVTRGERIASTRLEAGCCFVNSMVKSDPRLPFGGIKESGYGRELSRHGIKEFVNTKTVYVG